MRKYPLYYTLNCNLSDKPLKKKQLKELSSKLSEESNSERIKAVLMLIAEHARVNEILSIDTEKIKLPYKMKEKNGDVIFEIENLPDDLQQILWKFIKL